LSCANINALVWEQRIPEFGMIRNGKTGTNGQEETQSELLEYYTDTEQDADGDSGQNLSQETNCDDVKVTAKKLLQLVNAQEFKCALTGQELSPPRASIDHIVPLSKGGAHAMHNLQVIDRDINLAKGKMTNAEFIEMCRLVVFHANSGSL
jgi:CRISPR/Cas system Type II protein with McrA/HNH and RuvC-like nuclease domain